MAAVRILFYSVSIILIIGCSKPAQDATTPELQVAAATPAETIIERAARLELNTEYTPPPGDPMAHHTMGFARTLCSAVFVTGLEPDFAAEHVGYFTAPYEHRGAVINRDVDYDSKMAHLTMANGVVRSAKYIGDLGCVPLPIGESAPYYEPPDIVSSLPDPATTVWPMGDLSAEQAIPVEVDQDLLAEAVETIFDPASGRSKTPSDTPPTRTRTALGCVVVSVMG